MGVQQDCTAFNSSSSQSSATANRTTDSAATATESREIKRQSSIPTWLHTHYADTCSTLDHEMANNSAGLPWCYENGMFTLSTRSPIFDLMTYAQLMPEMFYKPQYFLWLPHLLTRRIPCPACLDSGWKHKNGNVPSLANHSWPRVAQRVVDIEHNMWIISR